MYGFCYLGVVPLRKESSDKSEMVSQLLFGEVFEILESTEKWAKIKLAYDQYEGWIDKKQFLYISLDEFEEIQYSWKHVLTRSVGSILCNEVELPVVFGSFFPASPRFSIGGNRFVVLSETVSSKTLFLKEILAHFNGVPYLWGGRSPLGIDCSGFTQNVFKARGILLLRDAYQQAMQGISIDTINEMKDDDLLFFSNEDNNQVIHVGIYLGGFRIMHASGYVRTDLIDEKGIYNETLRSYTHILHSIRRMQ